VESTPTFFIGDRALAGAYPVDTFRVAIDQAIAKLKATP
jgi:protein-disulfide isomerase